MKWILTRLLIISLLFFPFTLITQAAETYEIDPMHTYVLWHISHFGFSNPSGKWMVEGTLAIDEKKPQNSQVSVKINMTDIVTGIPKLDEHLRTAAFFDVEKYPVATFVSDKVLLTGKNTADVRGLLTMHGVSKPVTLKVKLNKIGVNPITQKKSMGFTASTILNRSEFGMNTLLPGLGDEVKINIEAEAGLKNA